MSIEVRISAVEKMISSRTEKLKDLKERYDLTRRSMASILESLEADKKELEQLKKEAHPQGE